MIKKGRKKKESEMRESVCVKGSGSRKREKEEKQEKVFKEK